MSPAQARAVRWQISNTTREESFATATGEKDFAPGVEASDRSCEVQPAFVRSTENVVPFAVNWSSLLIGISVLNHPCTPSGAPSPPPMSDPSVFTGEANSYAMQSGRLVEPCSWRIASFGHGPSGAGAGSVVSV